MEQNNAEIEYSAGGVDPKAGTLQQVASNASGSSSPLALGEDEDGSSSSSDDSDVYEVDTIVGHRRVNGKDQYRIRWQKYTAEDDTWEPAENLIGSNIPNLIEQFWEEQKQKKSGKRSRKSDDGGSSSAALAQSGDVEFEKDAGKEKSGLEEGQEGEMVKGNESWYGIKADEGHRETRRLFVADRILTDTEKMLSEMEPGVRVLRGHLRPQPSAGSKQEHEADTSTASAPARRKGAAGGKKEKSRRQSAPSASSKVARVQKKTPKKRPAMKVDAEMQKESKWIPKQKLEGEEDTSLIVDQGESCSESGNKQDFPAALQTHTTVTSASGAKKQKHTSSGSRKMPTPTIIIAAPSRPPSLLQRGKQAAAAPPTATSVESKASKKKAEEGAGVPVSAAKLLHAEEDEVPEKMAKLQRPEALARPAVTTLPLQPLPKGTNVGYYLAKCREELGRKVFASAMDITRSQHEFEHWVMDGKVEEVRGALSAGYSDLENADSSGKTLLHRVCELKCGSSHIHCEMIDLLVRAGAKMNAREAKRGQIPLHRAVECRRLCHVRKLLALHSPVNLPDNQDQPPIIVALNFSDSELLTCLLLAGATFQPVFRAKTPTENKHLLKKVMAHQSRLSTSFDAARNELARNMVLRTVSPIFVNPLYEERVVEHSFRCDNANLLSPYHAFAVQVALSDFSNPEKLETRMWGPSPVTRVTVNDKECRPVTPNAKFMFLCSLRQGQNTLRVELSTKSRMTSSPTLSSANQWEDGFKLLTQVMQMQLTPKRGADSESRGKLSGSSQSKSDRGQSTHPSSGSRPSNASYW